jgi:lysophospholipase L1-like esterase
MKWLIKRGKQMGAPVSVFFQPWKSQGGEEIPDSEKQLAAFAQSTASKIVETMKQTESFHDLTGLQPELLGHYTDAVHLDDAGQEILAEAILKQIQAVAKKIRH